MKALIAPRPCHERVTHFNPHPDEGLSNFAGIEFGRDVFVGIENAPLVLLNAGQLPPDGKKVKDYEATRFVFGTCLGAYDEHGLPPEQRKEYAASSLVIRDLGLLDDPVMRILLEYTVRNDRHGHRARSKWDLASIMFAVNVNLPSIWHAQLTLDVSDDWFRTAYRYFQMRMAQGEASPKRPKGELSLNDYIMTFLSNEYDPDGTVSLVSYPTAKALAEKLGIESDRKFDQLLKLAARDHEAVTDDFDIFAYVEMKVALGESAEEINNRLTPIFRAKVRESELFWEAYDQLANNVQFHQLWHDPRKPEPVRKDSNGSNREQTEANQRARGLTLMYTIGIAWTDNPVAHKAFRRAHRDVDVMILAKSNGYVAINHNRLPRGPFSFRMRKNEPGGHRLSHSELTRDGNLYDENGRQRVWMNFYEGGWQLNGAFSCPEQTMGPPPTKQSVAQIIANCDDALLYIDEMRREERAMERKKKQERAEGGKQQASRPQEHRERKPKKAEVPKPHTDAPKFSNNPHVKA